MDQGITMPPGTFVSAGAMELGDGAVVRGTGSAAEDFELSAALLAAIATRREDDERSRQDHVGRRVAAMEAIDPNWRTNTPWIADSVESVLRVLAGQTVPYARAILAMAGAYVSREATVPGAPQSLIPLLVQGAALQRVEP